MMRTRSEEEEEGKPLLAPAAEADAPVGLHIVKPKRRITVEPILFSFMLFTYPMLPLSSQYIYIRLGQDLDPNGTFDANSLVMDNRSNCGMNESDPFFQFREQVQAQASYFSIGISLGSSIPAFFMGLLLGSISDKKGRKIAIIPPLLSGLLSTILYALVILLRWPLWVLIIASTIDGCGGFYQTLFVGCISYIADITTRKERAFRITITELIMFFAGIFSSLATGYWIDGMGYFWPTFFLCIGKALVLLYTIFFLPETIRPDKTTKVPIFTCEHVTHIFRLFTHKADSKRKWKLIILFMAFFTACLVVLGNGIDTLFQMNAPLCWGPLMIGYYNAAYIAITALGGMAMIWLLKKCIEKDEWLPFISSVSSIVSYLYRAFVKTTLMAFFVPVLNVGGMLMIPTIRAVMSKLVSPGEQGALFGAIGCLEVICSFVGRVLFNTIYSNTLSTMGNFVAAYLVMAGFMVLTNVIAAYYIFKVRKEPTTHIIDTNDTLHSSIND